MDLAAKRYFSVGRMVTAVVRRWTEITMVLADLPAGFARYKPVFSMKSLLWI